MTHPLSMAQDYAGSSRIPGAAPPRSALGDGGRWYAVHTLPNRELCAQSHLENQGFQTFLPRFSKKVRHARQCKTVLAPLFPRYLFIELNLRRDRWRSVNSTFGVSSLVMQNDGPAPAPKGVVEALRASVDEGGCFRFPQLKAGQSIRVVSGPFADQIGVLEHLTSSERLHVLLDIMNSQVRVNMDTHCVAPA